MFRTGETQTAYYTGKERYCSASFEPGMTVSLVAWQHGVAASSYFSGASNTRREVLLLWPQGTGRSYL